MDYIIYSSENEFRNNVFKFIISNTKKFDLKNIKSVESIVNTLSCSNLTPYRIFLGGQTFEFKSLFLEDTNLDKITIIAVDENLDAFAVYSIRC